MSQHLLTQEFLEENYFRLYKTQREIAKLANCSQWHVSEAMKRYGMQARPTGKIVNLIGKRFGSLVVVEPVFRRERKAEFRWRCLCDCGQTVDVKRGSLVYGSTKSCGCFKESRVGSSHHAWKGFGSVPGGFLSRYKCHAKRRRIVFEVTLPYLDNLFAEQEGKCAISGLDLSFEHYGYKREYSNASLDRIDSTLGYVVGNVQWVDKDVNLMKQSLTQKRFVELCRTIVRYHEPKETPYPACG